MCVHALGHCMTGTDQGPSRRPLRTPVSAGCWAGGHQARLWGQGDFVDQALQLRPPVETLAPKDLFTPHAAALPGPWRPRQPTGQPSCCPWPVCDPQDPAPALLQGGPAPARAGLGCTGEALSECSFSGKFPRSQFLFQKLKGMRLECVKQVVTQLIFLTAWTVQLAGLGGHGGKDLPMGRLGPAWAGLGQCGMVSPGLPWPPAMPPLLD